MPLIELSGPEAVAQRKNNPFATWGNRGQKNRIEPVTKPGFDVPFKMKPGEKIFTVGSCFARHVERVLIERGFDIPMRALFDRPEFAGIDTGVVNNFGTPSIYNEFAWALGEQDFVAEDHFVEVQNSKFVDMHVINSVRPADYQTVVNRRAAITGAYRSFMECQVVVITLGLVEVWYDSTTGYYLNAAPRPTMLRNEPDRFKLHVLSFDEVYAYLEKTVDLIQKHGKQGVQIIITISPVPLAATHRADDVIVANSYSKSVLRTAADTIIAKRDRITYYPSFESVSISDRSLTWKDDFTHVTDEIVAVNINRMVDAYVETKWTLADHQSAIEQGGALMAVERAAQVRQESRADAETFFATFADISKTSFDFAMEHAQFLIGIRDFAGTLEIIANAPENRTAPMQLLKAQALIRLKDGQAAYDVLASQVENGNRLSALWNNYLEAAKLTDDPDKVLTVLSQWTEKVPKRAGRANGLVGRWFFEKGERERALSYYDMALTLDPEDALIRIYRTEALLAMLDFDAAQQEFERINPRLPNEAILLERLKNRMVTR